MSTSAAVDNPDMLQGGFSQMDEPSPPNKVDDFKLIGRLGKLHAIMSTSS